MKTQILDSLSLLSRLQRQPHEHKGDAGKLLLIGGSTGMAGAIFLAGKAALYTGAGWTILGVLDQQAATFILDQPELMIKAADKDLIEQLAPDVLAIGPGLGKGGVAKDLLRQALAVPYPLVLDADAINLLSEDSSLMSLLQQRPAFSTVLTPHPGEAARLLQVSSADIQKDRIQSIQQLVQITQSIVVLKGRHTLIAAPNQTILRCERGNSGMGVGGMGDVLTGLVSSLITQGLRHHISTYEAVCLGVELHAAAADFLVNKGVGPIGLTPSELIFELRELINIK